MNSNVEERRLRLLALLEETQHETRAGLSGLDQESVVHTDERAWRVRDVVGHLGVWNAEAARSLEAHAAGRQHHCVPSEASYFDYNGAAAAERSSWTVDQVWAEYEQSHKQLRSMVERLPTDRWDASILYPWNETGTVEGLVTIMMKHERIDHCDIISNVPWRFKTRRISGVLCVRPGWTQSWLGWCYDSCSDHSLLRYSPIRPSVAIASTSRSQS